MTDATAPARRTPPLRLPAENVWLWVGAALVLGAVAGVAALGAGVYGVAAVAGAIGLGAVIVWRYEVGICAAIALNSLDVYGQIISKPVAITWYQVALVMSLGSWALSWLWRPKEKLAFSAVDWGMGAMVFAAMWSLPFSMDPRATTIAIVRLIFLWAFALLCANALSKRWAAEAMAWTLMASASVSSLLAMAQSWIPGFNYGSIRYVSDFGVLSVRASAFFHDPNYLAGFLVVSFLTALAFLVHARSWVRAGFSAVAIGIIGLGLALTLSRTGMVGVAVGVLIVLVTAPRGRRVWLLGLVGAAGVAVVVKGSQTLINRIVSIGDVASDASNATRVWMFVSTWGMFVEKWAFGTGLAAFYQLYPKYRYTDALSSVIRPHEIPLAFAAETGVAGVIAQFVLIWGVIKTFWRKRPNGWTTFEALALAGIVSLSIQSLFQYYLYFEYLWLFIAFGVAANRMARHEEASDV